MVHEGVNIEHLSALANLELSGAERRNLEREFSSIVGFVDALRATDTGDVPPTNQVTELENVYRVDSVEHFPHRRTLLELAPNREASLFRVPAVFLDEGL